MNPARRCLQLRTRCQTPPQCSAVLRLSRSFALPLWPTSRAPVPRRLPASSPLPHGRGSWLTAWCVVRGAALPGGPRGNKGVFTPHPQPLSPSRGEGCHARLPQKGDARKLKEENTRIPAVLSSAIVSREDATPRRIDTVLRRISRDRQFKQPSAHPQLKTEN